MKNWEVVASDIQLLRNTAARVAKMAERCRRSAESVENYNLCILLRDLLKECNDVALGIKDDTSVMAEYLYIFLNLADYMPARHMMIGSDCLVEYDIIEQESHNEWSICLSIPFVEYLAQLDKIKSFHE